jgi:hypothetical protein
VNATIVRYAAGRATLALPSAWRRVDVTRAPHDEAERLASAWSLPADGGGTRFLTQTIAAARRAGVVFAAVLAGDGDLPVYGSFVCAELSAEPWSAVQIELGWRGAGRNCTTISLPVGPAVRTTAVATLGGHRAGWELQLAIPAFDRGGMLMAFTTPVAELAEFFDPVAMAIATTLRWKEARS